MEVYADLLKEILLKQDIHVTFPELTGNTQQIVETECCQALQKIQNILRDDSLSDVECFKKIEEIVCVFEALGGGGGRHDFA